MKKQNMAKVTLIMALSTSVFFSQTDVVRASDGVKPLASKEEVKIESKKKSRPKKMNFLT